MSYQRLIDKFFPKPWRKERAMTQPRGSHSEAWVIRAHNGNTVCRFEPAVHGDEHEATLALMDDLIIRANGGQPDDK